jgi:hypothetical protein
MDHRHFSYHHKIEKRKQHLRVQQQQQREQGDPRSSTRFPSRRARARTRGAERERD